VLEASGAGAKLLEQGDDENQAKKNVTR